MFELLIYIGILVGSAAIFLWVVEGIARHIGGRNAWLFFLVGLPFAAGAGLAYLNRVELAWWQLVLYPLAGPVIASGILLLAYAAVNPFALIVLARVLCQRAWSRISHGGRR